MMDRLSHRFNLKLQELIRNQERDNTAHPKEKKFEHGVQIGEWRGLNRALDLLHDMIEEDARADNDF